MLVVRLGNRVNDTARDPGGATTTASGGTLTLTGPPVHGVVATPELIKELR
jgi:hypothetical protein